MDTIPDIHRIQADVARLIDDHFNDVEGRLEEVRRAHFTSVKPVFRRHMRNMRDVPADLLVLPRSLGRLAVKPVRMVPSIRRRLDRGKTAAGPATERRSGKERELERIVLHDFLDVDGLEQKLKEYIRPYRLSFEKELAAVVDKVPALQRESFQLELEKRLADLTVPSEGAREALMFLAAGVLGKCLSDKVVFGSALGGGQAAAATLYLSHVSWFESVLIGFSLSSVPAWVGVAGAVGGLAAVALTAPLAAPLLEVGVNRLRARKVLRNILDQARKGLTGRGPDGVNIAGRLAVYVQLLPDTLQVARSILPKLA